MANQISPNALRALDSNGDPAGGAKLYVYQTGTTTPVTVYTNEALTIAHASPVVADADGYFAQIFYGGSSAVRVVITDSVDVTLEDIDPGYQIGGTGSAASDVSVTPFTGVSSVNVQDALEEIQGNVSDDTLNLRTLVVTTGSSNAYAVTAADTITAYAAGQRFLLRINHDNTGAATLNVDGVGAKDLQKYNSSNVLAALTSGDLNTGDVVEVSYDGTRFVLITGQIQLANDEVTTAKIADSNVTLAKLASDARGGWELTSTPYDNAGTVTTIETADFADGYDYRIVIDGLQMQTATDGLDLEVYGETATAYTSAVQFMGGIASNPYRYAILEFSHARESRNTHFVKVSSSRASSGSGDAFFLGSNNDQMMVVRYTTAQKILKARLSGGNMTSGTVTLERRPT